MTKFIDQNRNEMKFHFIPAKKFDGFLLEFWGGSGAKAKRSCRARKMRKNEPTLAIVAVHTEENEPPKAWKQKFHYFNDVLTRKSRIVLRKKKGRKKEVSYCKRVHASWHCWKVKTKNTTDAPRPWLIRRTTYAFLDLFFRNCPAGCLRSLIFSRCWGCALCINQDLNHGTMARLHAAWQLVWLK